MRHVMRQEKRRVVTASLLALATMMVIVGTLSGFQSPAQQGNPNGGNFIPNGTSFVNPGGASQTFSTVGGGIEETGPFFQSLGSNGRSCATCHQPSDGMSVAAANVQVRFNQSQGSDPIFRTNDGSNCDHNIDISTFQGRASAYSLLRTRGLIRIAIAVPAGADYAVTSVNNPYACNETNVISQYRRPLPATNLPFLSTVMWDGRESTPLTGATKIVFNNYPGSLQSDLAHQSLDATVGHAQGDGTRPTAAEQQQIVNFEMALFTAQAQSQFPLNRRLQMAGPYRSPRSRFLLALTRASTLCFPTDQSSRPV